jgi:hypothetical protein
MTKPTENAPWWNLLFEIVALPAVNAALGSTPTPLRRLPHAVISRVEEGRGDAL